MTRKAVFLDRDGVLVRDDGLVTSPHQLHLLPGVGTALRQLGGADWRLVVVTNQAVIARGLINESELHAIHAHLAHLLERDGAPPLTAIKYCPHHPQATIPQWHIDCPCRKPKPGMLLASAAEFDLSLDHCVMIGDRPSDIAAGHAAGCRTILLETGHHLDPPISGASMQPEPIPDHRCTDLTSAAQWILGTPCAP